MTLGYNFKNMATVFALIFVDRHSFPQTKLWVKNN